MNRLNIAVAIFASCILMAEHASSTEIPAKSKSKQLIILIDPDAAEIESEPEDIIAASSRNTARAVATRQLLAEASAIRPLVAQRHDREFRQRFFRKSDPEQRLQRYVLLDFPTVAAADAAQQRLSRDGRILYARHPEDFSFAATPNDTYFPYVGFATNGQWGLSALNLPGAWDYTKGWGYIGVLDNGVQAGINGTHPELMQNLRMALSWNFGSNTADVDEMQGFPSVDVMFPAGHGTHVAGIIGATSNNGTGVSGACWNCSLLVGKISSVSGGIPQPSEVNIINGLNSMARWGVQAINMSLGIRNDPDSCNQPSLPRTCPTYSCSNFPNDPLCVALELAHNRGVAIVAAAGNQQGQLQLPARDLRTISVGGVQLTAQGTTIPWNQFASAPTSQAFDQNLFQAVPSFYSSIGETGTNSGANQWVAAPARTILSTFYQVNTQYQQPVTWSQISACGSRSSFSYTAVISSTQSAPLFLGGAPAGTTPGFSLAGVGGNYHWYGTCTGTSMAAPFITGIVGLMRSVNPLLSINEVKTKLAIYADSANLWNPQTGYGVPNAGLTLADVAQTNNFVTPLFAFHSPDYKDYFYSSIPQMGSAVLNLSLPNPGGAWIGMQTLPYYTFEWLGPTVTGYASFPGVNPASPPAGYTAANYVPRARLKVFTQEVRNGTTLDRIYRYSSGTVVPGSVRHFYAIGEYERSQMHPADWTLDGIEGFMYPADMPQPTGTVPVYRTYHPTDLSAVLYPINDIGDWYARGFNSIVLRHHVGWAILN